MACSTGWTDPVPEPPSDVRLEVVAQDDVLARGAYDARLTEFEGDKTLARSPAVNAGTEDGYDYDTTSTNPKRIDLGTPDIGYHYYRRIADNDDPLTEDQIFQLSFNVAEEKALKTDRYRAISDTGAQALTVEGDIPPGFKRVVWSAQFVPILPPGPHMISVFTQVDEPGGIETWDSSRVHMPLLVDWASPAQEAISVSAVGVDEQGEPLETKRVHYERNPDGSVTVYYNPSQGDLKAIRVQVGMPKAENPWKVEFGDLEENNDPEVRHFEEYDIDFPEPAE